MHISIHAAREGGDVAHVLPPVLLRISIHAAREGGDAFASAASRHALISIHAAREGGDWRCLGCVLFSSYFNPRRP